MSFLVESGKLFINLFARQVLPNSAIKCFPFLLQQIESGEIRASRANMRLGETAIETTYLFTGVYRGVTVTKKNFTFAVNNFKVVLKQFKTRIDQVICNLRYWV